MTPRRGNKAHDTQHVSRLKEFADRLDLIGSWAQVPLPESDCKRLREIANRIKYMRVTAESSAKAVERAASATVLFIGPNSTGKTMAAAMLANELDCDLYRVDLSRVVSGYIGETEKNLRRVLDAAAESGAILLFDEADALFGKRTEVKDSHNRYANIETSYLLERMEASCGLVLLATNMRTEFDESFASRFDCIVEFRDLTDQRVHRMKMDRKNGDDT